MLPTLWRVAGSNKFWLHLGRSWAVVRRCSSFLSPEDWLWTSSLIDDYRFNSTVVIDVLYPPLTFWDELLHCKRHPVKDRWHGWRKPYVYQWRVLLQVCLSVRLSWRYGPSIWKYRNIGLTIFYKHEEFNVGLLWESCFTIAGIE